MAETKTPKFAELTESQEKSVSVNKSDVEKSVNDDQVYATTELHAAFEDMRSALKDGRITEASIRRLAAINDINVDEMMRFSKMSRLDMEKSPFYKSDLSDQPDVDTIMIDGHKKYFYPMKKGDVVECDDVKLTKIGEHKIKCESEYLGNFEYDDTEYGVKFKEITEDDGSISYLPYLKYEGDDEQGTQFENAIQDYAEDVVGDADEAWHAGGKANKAKSIGLFAWAGVTSVAALPGNLVGAVASGFDDNQTLGHDTCDIPDGVKVLDYTFAGRDNMQHFPTNLPNSITSMHAAFKGCSRMTVDTHGYDNPKIKLPENVEDMSLAFKDCSNLQAVYLGFDDADAMPESVVNITECWCGCESMSGEKILANDERGYRNFFTTRAGSAGGIMGMTDNTVTCDLPNFGGELTPYLSAALARDAVANVSGKTDKEKLKSYVDHMDYVIDYTGKISDAYKDKAKQYDQAKLDKAQTAATMYYQGDSHLGSIMSLNELASNGARSDNPFLDENGHIQYDKTGLMRSMQVVPPDEKSSPWEKVLMYGGTFAAIAGLTGGVTKNSYAALGAGAIGTVALSSAFPNMYNSMYPVLNFTRNHLPEGSIKTALSTFIEENCPCAKTNALNNEIARKNNFWKDDYSVAAAFLSGKDPEGNATVYADQETECKPISPLTDIFDRASSMAVAWNENEMDTLMKNSAVSCQNTKTLLVLATYMNPNIDSFEDCTKPVNTSIQKAMDSMEQYWNECSEKGTYDKETICADMREYYTKMFHAIDVYNTSAKSAINSAHNITSKENRLERHGLAMIDEAYTTTLMDSLKEMDEKYHFMDDASWQKISHTNLEGATYSAADHSFTYATPDTYAHDFNAFLKERYGKKYAKEHGLPEPDVSTDVPDNKSDEASAKESTEKSTETTSASKSVADSSVSAETISQSITDLPDDSKSDNSETVTDETVDLG